MSPRTIFLARLLGLYCIVEGLSLMMHKQATVEMMNALLYNTPAFFMVGLIPLAIGLAIVLGHNVWSGGALPVVVTLVGWAALLKGLLISFLPQEVPLASLHYEQLFYLYTAIPLILGIYLTYAGFRQKSAQAL